jgi:hypothetical protein
VGLARVFLIHIKEFGDFEPLPRLAVVGDEGVEILRRRRGVTRVHSLAIIACSIKVVGAITGSLMSVHLPMEARSGGIVGDETGDDEPNEQWRSIDSHSALSDRRDVFFRHCFRQRDSADEESDRFGEGEMEEGQRGKSP